LPFIGFFAWHYWFVVTTRPAAIRWEVWQTKNAGGLVHRAMCTAI
jgi:hypothetical protein